jgi:hypothetical protein
MAQATNLALVTMAATHAYPAVMLGPDHLAPFLCPVGNVLSELGRRHRHRQSASRCRNVAIGRPGDDVGRPAAVGSVRRGGRPR